MRELTLYYIVVLHKHDPILRFRKRFTAVVSFNETKINKLSFFYESQKYIRLQLPGDSFYRTNTLCNFSFKFCALQYVYVYISF